ncbi:MAG: DUF3788 domain-containing protein [Clostridiales bacterium]|nr:DUF3788 domain-containing protein [Clostridiales bacterium]
MLDITDRSKKPDISEIISYVDNPVFDEICTYMRSEYNAGCEIEYSRDNLLPGWNVKFFKSGRTLCRLYPDRGKFKVLVVVGKREKERVEARLGQMSEEMRSIYNNTKEGMGQRWLMIPLCSRNALRDDVMTLVDIRRYQN